MAKQPKLNTDLSNESDGDFYTLVMLIYNLLILNHGLFPGLLVDMGALGPVPPNTLGAAIAMYNDIRLKPAYDGKRGDTAKARLAVQRIITENGNWLNTFCNHDLGLMQKTGYPFAKEDGAQGKLEQSEITLVPTLGGMDFIISKVIGTAIRYGVMYTNVTNAEVDPAKWENFHYAGHRDGNIPNLSNVNEYKFSSFAMGTSTDLTYSHALSAKPL